MGAVVQFVTRKEMESFGREVYEALPPQFRDRLPAGATAHPQNAEIFRRAFQSMDSHVDRLFSQLGYQEGQRWDQWKLLAAFYLVEKKIGKHASTAVGTKIFETMPWPPSVTCLEDALLGIEHAYRASHDASFAEIGGWPVLEQRPGYLKIANATPYPCHLEEGTLAGVCAGFKAQRPTYQLLSSPKPKREGGVESVYEVKFLPKT
jgi:hypothetical protein